MRFNKPITHCNEKQTNLYSIQNLFSLKKYFKMCHIRVECVILQYDRLNESTGNGMYPSVPPFVIPSTTCNRVRCSYVVRASLMADIIPPIPPPPPFLPYHTDKITKKINVNQICSFKSQTPFDLFHVFTNFSN